ncbi:MAG: DUF423 domain-containing protein [Deltaproteobacteria bacterium]|nr:DUF423 domain-containing protein [Deltaproteobacteria bacterium]
MARRLLMLGAIVAMLSVALGAFGAHALAEKLDARALHSWDTAARYQMFHGLALIATAWASDRWPGRAPKVAAYAFGAGLLLFCGSLYALALGSPRAFGAVAPLGGLSFMIGWGALAFAARDNV